MGKILRVVPNRYDGQAILGSLTSENVSILHDSAYIELHLGNDHDIHIQLPAASGIVDASALEIARLVFLKLAELDNLVQHHCAAECNRSGLRSEAFESLLAYVILDADNVTLRYWGAVVNTEWDEVFSIGRGQLTHVRSGTGLGTGSVVTLTPNGNA